MPYTETVAPDEESRFATYAAELLAIQRAGNAKAGVGRALHRKQTAGVEARFTVRADLPETLQVGPFAPGAEYPAFVRFSNGGAENAHDRAPDLRGLALKLVGVDGPKVLGDARTQDFLSITSPVQPFRDPDEFLRFVRIARAGKPAALPLRVLREFGLFRGFGVLRGLAGATRAPESFATASWYSAAPIRWGATAARTALVPVDPPALKEPLPDSRERYAEDLRARLLCGPLQYDLQVQTWADEATTPIEDASVDWPTPYSVVGRLVIASQDLGSERAKQVAAYVEGLSFDPWHAVEALRPLGAVMRARKHAYFASLTERAATPEPTGPLP